MADSFDLTQPLDPVALTGTDKPFELTPKARDRFNQAVSDVMSLFKGRTLEGTVVHMQQIGFQREATGIAGAAASDNPGLMACGRIFVPVGERAGIMPADPKWSETPFIKAAEEIAWAVYKGDPALPQGREATLEEKSKAAALMLLCVQHLESISPGADKLLPRLVEFLENQGFKLGNNVPASLRIAGPGSDATPPVQTLDP
jgi:hypothetical protein